MKVIALLILATACVAPIVATQNQHEPWRSFKPKHLAKSLYSESTQIIHCNPCTAAGCAKLCLKNANCRAFQLKIRPPRTHCRLMLKFYETNQMQWIRKENTIGSIDASVTGYVAKTARMCLTEGYKTHVNGVHGCHKCAKECNKHTDCRGFRLTYSDGCEIFRFSACSRNLVLESCNTKDRIWIRNIPGLPAGSLCPSGYSGKHGASTYKMFHVADWYVGDDTCKKEKGLVKYADADDRKEASHFHKLQHSLGKDRRFFVGGKLDNYNKYTWDTCGHAVDKNMWTPGQPSSKRCCLVVNSAMRYGFDDSYGGEASYAMCECVNPFE